MKLLSVVVPCYNSEAYMCRALETLLSAGDKLELIIVNDGSTDDTLKIAKQYQKMYPQIIKVIDQENKGHGGAINSGLREATGLYFRVVDSDDWVREESLLLLIKSIEMFRIKEEFPDVIVTNFVYEKSGKKNKKVMRYGNVFEGRKILRWEDINNFHQGQYLLMHSTTFKTNLLQKNKLVLPEHTFYVDNLFVFLPLQYVQTIYYIDTNLYRYFIGREGQSVNEEIMCKRIDQQILVNKMMIDSFDYCKINNKKQRNYLTLYLMTIQTVSSVLLNKIGTEEAMLKKTDLWQYLKDRSPRLYKHITRTILGRVSSMNNKASKIITKIGYRIAKKIYGFN